MDAKVKDVWKPHAAGKGKSTIIRVVYMYRNEQCLKITKKLYLVTCRCK